MVESTGIFSLWIELTFFSSKTIAPEHPTSSLFMQDLSFFFFYYSLQVHSYIIKIYIACSFPIKFQFQNITY